MQHRVEGVSGLCADCVHWDHLQTHPANEVVHPGAQAGICRRNAPRHIELDPRTPLERAEGYELPTSLVSGIRPGMFPNTKGNDWCGEHPLRAAFARMETDDLHHQMVKKRRELDNRAKEAVRRGGQPGQPPRGGPSESR